MNLRLLLLPLSMLFLMATAIRKKLYRGGVFRPYQPPVPTIVVGNLSMGGTGKTPMTEYILALLQKYKRGFLSRGYGRHTKGFLEISAQSTAQQVGDEPLQIAQKFPSVKAAVCEKRPQGIKRLLQNHPYLNALVLDDAYQHLPLKAHYYILLTTYQQPFYKDWVVPAGNLRESRHEAARAHCIVVTKCPETMSRQEQKKYTTSIARYSKAPVYFSSLQISAPTNSAGQRLAANAKVTVITAIAQPHFWLQQIEKQYHLQYRAIFKDHHYFTNRDIQPLLRDLRKQENLAVVCTEKDFVKLKPLIPAQYEHRFFVQRVQHRFLNNSAAAFAEPILKLLSAT